MYEDVLNRRKMQLRELDLAANPALVKEWTTLVAELDVVMRLNRGYVAQERQAGRQYRDSGGSGRGSGRGYPGHGGGGNGIGNSNGRGSGGGGGGRRRSNSFLEPPRNVAQPQFEIPREAQAAAGSTSQRRPRATSFNFGDEKTMDLNGGGAESSKEKVTRWQTEAKELAKEESFASPADYHGEQSASDYLAEQQLKLARARAVAQQMLDAEAGGGGGDALETGTLTLSSLEAHDRKMKQEHPDDVNNHPELMFDRSSGGARSKGGSDRGGGGGGGSRTSSRNGSRTG